MTLRATVLVLLSALFHAAWNALIKRERSPRAAGLAVLAVAAAVAAALAPFAGQTAFPNPRALAWALGAGAFEGAYFAALGMALARGPLGPAYTVARGGAMLVIWPISIVFLGEAFAWPARIGALLIAVGLAVTTLRPREEANASSLAGASLCAFGIAGYHICYKLALEARAEPRALFAVALACALPINAASLGRTGWRESLEALRTSPWLLCAGGALCTASFLVLLDALSTSGAGAVLTLRNTSVLFAQALALWSGERADRRVLGGAALVVGGAVLLAR
jgi:drug/metabolite transporter (DMT)-like permease